MLDLISFVFFVEFLLLTPYVFSIFQYLSSRYIPVLILLSFCAIALWFFWSATVGAHKLCEAINSGSQHSISFSSLATVLVFFVRSGTSMSNIVSIRIFFSWFYRSFSFFLGFVEVLWWKLTRCFIKNYLHLVSFIGLQFFAFLFRSFWVCFGVRYIGRRFYRF